MSSTRSTKQTESSNLSRSEKKSPKKAKSPKRSVKLYANVFAILLAASAALCFGVEWIQRGSVVDTWQWIRESKNLYFVNAGITFLVVAFVYALIGSLIPSIAVSTLLVSLFSLVNYFKTKLIGEPFFPWDIFLNKESSNIIPLVTGKEAYIRIGIVLVTVIAILLLRFILPRMSLPLVSRVAIGLLSVYALYSFGLRTSWATNILDRAGVSEIVWDQQQNYGANGTALAFTLNVRNVVVQKPAGYNEESISELAKNISAGTTHAKVTDPFKGKQPNVIFIMNEAFWDPTLLPNVKFSEDPIPTVHKLQKQATSGYLLSPQFGGGTSNVEFEVLSGNSMSALPAGSVPYQQYVNKPLPSLASYFENKGYKSMGIHSYEGWFWNREDVYKQLGFEEFLSKQYFEDPEYKGAFISDDEVSRHIVQEVEESDRPMFIYAVTMQNHGPYDDNRYGETDIKAQGNLTADAKSTLETYTQGVRDADRSLQLLIDEFKKSNEPTVIVFYGDHLPMLGMDYDVYKQGGFIQSSDESKWSLEELKKMHSIPFVTWSNVKLPRIQMPTLSDSFLGANILKWMNMELPANFAYNYELSKKLPGLLRNLTVDAKNNLATTVPAELEEEVNKYAELQYDSMFGEKYLGRFVDQDFLNKAVISNYNEELEQSTLSKSRQEAKE